VYDQFQYAREDQHPVMFLQDRQPSLSFYKLLIHN